MLKDNDTANIDRVLRALAVAGRSLRLYPAASPIPRQSVEAVMSALAEVFSAEEGSLHLAVARDGFSSKGQPVAVGVPGGMELSDDLRAQGVSAMEFLPTVTGEQVLAMLEILAKPPEEVRADGGFAAQAQSAGIADISFTEVLITLVDVETGGNGLGTGRGPEGAERDEMLRSMADNPEQLETWLGQVTSGSAQSMQADLFSLVNAVGPEGEDDLADSFSSAMGGLAADNRDALLGLAMEHGPFRRLMSDVFSYQSPAEIASTVLEGAYGRNMLALSNALTSLPLERVSDEVRATIHQLLPGTGRTATETAFLDHMIAVRERVEPEPSLAAADHTYLAVAQASAIKTSDLDVAKRAIGAAGAALDAAGVRTMFSLLDQQIGTDQAQSSAAGLITMVPRLVVERQLPLAEYILNELNRRADSIGGTDALRATATPASMGALIDIVIEDDSRFDMAAMILKSGGEEAGSILVSEAITRKADGIALAERFLGKRAIDLLQTAVLEAQWFQLAPVVSRLTVEGGPRSIATIEALLRRPDAQSRKEIVQGLASAGGPVAERLLCEIVRDPNPEVAVAAARELAKAKMPGGSVAIAARLGELDIDNADFELARELISALARTPGEAADATLKKLGSRRAIIKRGHFNDIQTAVAAALQARTQGASR